MDLSLRSPEIFKALLTKRQILLQGDTDDDLREKITRLILYLNAIDHTPITLFIDSCGGNTDLSLSICDVIQYSQASVIGLAVGDAQSAGFRILQACDQRLAYPWARFMFHAPAVNGKSIDSDDWDQHIANVQEYHNEQLNVYVKRSGRSLNFCKKWAKEERRFFAPEALRLGFLDEIIRPPKK